MTSTSEMFALVRRGFHIWLQAPARRENAYWMLVGWAYFALFLAKRYGPGTLLAAALWWAL